MTTPPHEPARDRRIGPYRLLHEIGRGAQGQVYLAEDTRLSRRVALKVLSTAYAPSGAALQRFQREAAAASKLDHPGICSIHEAGQADGFPFIAMRYVEGEPLSKKIADSRARAVSSAETLAGGAAGKETPAPAPEPSAGGSSSGNLPSSREQILRVVAWIEQTARALHHAHETGLIHRDIKPGNIMITTEEDPVILDFGLARDEEGDLQTLTHSGDLLGTPAYMSPEQLVAQRIPLDRRTDVYSLGVTLYECLTLERPFDAPSREGLYQKILTGEASDPRSRNPHIPRDLKVVLETAMERDRNRRYKTALDFAEDLRRVRRYEPIKARPAGPLLRFRRWTQRNPVLATATLGLIFVLATGLGVALVLLQEVRKERDENSALLDAKAQALAQLEVETAARAKALGEKEEALARAEGLYLTAQSSKTLPENPGLSLLLAIAGAERQAGNLSRNVLLAALAANRERRTLLGHRGPVAAATLSHDAGIALTVSADGTFRLWDAHSGRRLLERPAQPRPVAALSPDGRRVAAANGSRVIIHDARSGEEALVLEGHEKTVLSIEFAGDGASIATGSEDGTARLWDAATGTLRETLTPIWPRAPTFASFSPGGTHLLTSTAQRLSGLRAVRAWTTDPGKPMVALKGVLAGISCFAASRDGSRLLTGSADRQARLWDMATGEEIAVLEGHTEPVTAVSFSPDDSRGVTASRDRLAIVWDLGSAAPVARLEGHTSGLRAAVFSPDGGRVLTTGEDGTARIWDAASGNELARFLGHEGTVATARFSSDGELAITGASDGTARIWDAGSRAPLTSTLRPRLQGTRSAVWSPGGERVFFVGDGIERSELVDAASGATIPGLRAPPGGKLLGAQAEAVVAAAYSPDGRVILAVTPGAPPGVRLWNAETGKALDGFPYSFSDVAFTPDGGNFVGHFGGNKVGFFTVGPEGIHEERTFSQGFGTWVTAVAVTPGGDRALAWGQDASLRVWDCQSGEGLVNTEHSNRILSLCFQPGSDRLLTASTMPGGTLVLWESGFAGKTEWGGPVRASFTGVEYSRDGSRILVLSWDASAHVQDAATRQVIWRKGPPDTQVLAACLNPAGKQVLTLSGGPTAELWDIASERPALTLEGHARAVTAAAFTDDGARVVTASEDGSARVWEGASGRLVSTAPHGAPVLSATFHPDGSRFVTACRDGLIRVCDTGSGKTLRTLQRTSWSLNLASFLSETPPTGASFTGTGDRLLVFAGSAAHVFETAKGGHLARLGTDHDPQVLAAVIADGGAVAVTSHALPLEGAALELMRSRRPGIGALMIDHHEHLRLWDSASGRLLGALRSDLDGIERIAVSPSGHRVAAASPRGFRIWDTASGRTLVRFSLTEAPRSMAFSPDGSRILLSSDEVPRIRSADTGEILAVLSGPAPPLLAATWSPDGSRVISAWKDGSARIWDVASGTEPLALTGHPGEVRSAVLSGDGRWAATAASDKTVRVWDLSTGKERIGFPHGEAVNSVRFSADSRQVLTLTEGLTARSWPLELAADLLSAAAARKPRDLTPEEVERNELGSPESRAAYRRQWELRGLREDVDAILARLERAPRSPDLRADAARALAQTARVLGGAGTAEEAAAAGALAAKVLDRTGRSDPDLLAAVAGLEAAAGRPREAVLICEEALRLPAARRAHQEDLARFRQRALPDLVSSASIDAALDEPVAIIPEGAAWRYFPGFDEPSAELAWTAAEFADAGWLEGPSGFGFADGDDATVVAGLQGAATTIYLRHRFEVEGPQAFSGLVLSVKADDGFIAYLNGGEIGRVRAGAPGARLPFDAVASALAAEPLAWERISVPREALRPGRNVLAVQGLNQAKASSDFTLIPVLAGVPAADLDGERARFAAFRNAAGGPDREFRLQYLEGRLLARAGKSQEAGAVFEAAAAAAASRAEPALRIAELLRTSGDAAGAEARLRRVLAAADRDAAAVVWDLWFAIVAGDLKRDGRSLIASLPPAGAADGERLADIRWALSEIRDRKAIRMSAGGREFRDRNGRVWSADRFHQGVSEGRPISYPAAAIPVGEQRYAAQQSVVASPAVKHAGRLLAGDLYASRRTFGAEGLHPPGYRIPLPAGRYTVAVHFPSPPVLVEPGSSLAAATALPRIGLVLEGQRVLSGHEPPAPDEGTAGVERFELTVSDGFLDLEVIPERGEAALCALAIEVAG